MVGPSVAPEPLVQRVSAAIKSVAIISFKKRPRRGYLRHVGALPARSLRPLISSGGRFVQASNLSQSFAGMVTIRRPRMSASAASTALRRMNSLRLVRANSEAASKRARSSSLTRTLSTDVVIRVLCCRVMYDNSIQERRGQSRSTKDYWGLSLGVPTAQQDVRIRWRPGQCDGGTASEGIGVAAENARAQRKATGAADDEN